MSTRSVLKSGGVWLLGLGLLTACTAGPPDHLVLRALQYKGLNSGWNEYRVVDLTRTNGFELQPGAYQVEFVAVIQCLEAPDSGGGQREYRSRRYCEESDAGSQKTIRGSISFQHAEKGWRPVGHDFQN